MASATLLAMSIAWAQQPGIDPSSGWITTWAASPQAYSPPPADVTVPPGYRLPESISNQTIRQIVHVSAGGKQMRIRLSNEFGTRPVAIGAAAVALSIGEDRIKPGTSHRITFGGRSSVVIAPGAPMLSDPVAMDIASLSDLAISLYLPEDTRPETIHVEGLQTAYVSTPGNVVASATLPGAATFLQRLVLTSVEVRSPHVIRSPHVKGSIVTLGDSITDGEQSRPNANPSALARFDRDVGAVSGVRYLIVADGVNDLDSVGMTVNGQRVDNPAFAASADDLIGGYQQLIARAHAHGIRVIGATIMPYEGEGLEADGRVTSENAFTPAKEAMRNAINHWILASHAFDGVIDFDAVVRDPAHPSRLQLAYDSGDHIHPNASGITAMAESIDLALLH
jgi:lysophospholipase L1-like esterase